MFTQSISGKPNLLGFFFFHEVNEIIYIIKYYRSLQLKKIMRTKKGSESVMDEKFSILVTSTFFVANELHFNVRHFYLKYSSLFINF